MNHGIVGNEAAKFTVFTEMAAKGIIREILSHPGDVLVSGHCHLGGIDIWAEEIADELGRPKIIYEPENLRWQPRGYKDRNLSIAGTSHTVHNIVAAEYPPDYRGGMIFDHCYHCNSYDHVKSGGCWTAWKAVGKGKEAILYIIHPDGSVLRRNLLTSQEIAK